MTVETAIQWLEIIAGTFDGSQASRGQVVFLARELMERPESFPETFFLTLDEGNPVRERAQRLLRSGVVNAETTFGDIVLRKGDAQ